MVFITSLVRLLRGEVSTKSLVKRGLVIGDNFSRQGGVRIDTSYSFLIEIGNNVGLAPNVVILAHDNSTKRFIGVAKLGKVRIGNNVFIGANAIILPNVTIGNNVIIGAGSVVNKSISDDTVAAGNPVKVIQSISDFKKKNINLLKSRPLFDTSFGAIIINEEKKQLMKQKLYDGYGFYQCDNYSKMEESRNTSEN
ncbi:acyltransferase [Polaribacter sp. IC073]|uniref:acyltransferase n=1 Tax=Polaribacter sp. IC073 TaxID=2508540 RepID=UPI00167405DA|nr:acyltransferase [Polaribacter sp. IC073]